MNPVWLHLLVNHIPIIGTCIGLLIVVVALFMKNNTLRTAGLIVFVVTGLGIYAAHFSGEPAEEAIEHRPGISEKVIHTHEESAETALTLMSVGLVLALLVLFYKPANKRFRTMLFTAWMIVSIMAFIQVVITGHDGGVIRRPDLQEATPQGATPQEATDGD